MVKIEKDNLENKQFHKNQNENNKIKVKWEMNHHDKYINKIKKWEMS